MAIAPLALAAAAPASPDAPTPRRPDGLRARSVPLRLDVLVEQGVLVNVDTRGFRFTRLLDWRDVGIVLPPRPKRALRPPAVLLVHPDDARALARLASRAHDLLARHAFRFEALEAVLESASYRWLPWTAWESFEQAFAALQQELADLLDEVERRWPARRRELIAMLGSVARLAAQRLAQSGATRDPEATRRQLRRHLLAQLLAPDALRERLELSYRLALVQPAADLLEERARVAAAEAAIARARAAAEQARLETAARARQLELETVARQEELAREAAVKERLRQLRIEEARRRLADTLGPIDDAAQQLAAAVYQAATELRRALERHGHLPASSARRARELVQRFRLLNWVGDDALEHELAALAALARPHRRTRAEAQDHAAALRVQIDRVLARCAQDAAALARRGRLASVEL